MTDDAPSLVHGSAYFAPEEFQPDERCKCFAAEHGINLDLELAAFLANGFSRPKRWQQAFFHWLASRRVWNETQRAQDAARAPRGGQRTQGVVWQPNDRHKSFCAHHGLDLASAAQDYIRTGEPAERCTKDADTVFGRRLAKLVANRTKDQA